MLLTFKVPMYKLTICVNKNLKIFMYWNSTRAWPQSHLMFKRRSGQGSLVSNSLKLYFLAKTTHISLYKLLQALLLPKRSTTHAIVNETFTTGALSSGLNITHLKTNIEGKTKHTALSYVTCSYLLYCQTYFNRHVLKVTFARRAVHIGEWRPNNDFLTLIDYCR